MSKLAGKIWTVLGPTESDDAGQTLVHEHILADLRRAGHFKKPTDDREKELMNETPTM